VRTNASIPSTLLSLIVSAVLLPLSYVEHTHSVRPSSPIILYLLSSIFLDLPQLRTLLLQKETLSIAIVLFIVLTTRFLLLLAEAQSKKVFLKPELRKLPPESTSSILNRLFLWWLNDLFVLGNKGSISPSALFALDNELLSRILGSEMRKAWDRQGTFCPQ
jgi:ATP-binding cassette subfamily C (CFTR/MRP) protein 1